MMKEQFGQRGEQRGGGAVAGGIRNPEKRPPIGHAQPAINISADLDDRPISRGHIPAVESAAVFAE